ncbi:hypothetical protein ACN4EK_09060 [Pantanalinema rosaneae CENA516]|uniref:hypothetical protein n=1 Tax=Pantanalinema rosaneae TaxID=1620701 RepID=UPI003D6F3D85
MQNLSVRTKKFAGLVVLGLAVLGLTAGAAWAQQACCGSNAPCCEEKAPCCD